MKKSMKFLIKAFCWIIPGVLTVVGLKYLDENFETSCVKDSSVIEITSVQHRTAYVLLEDGTEMSVNQPRNLTVGDKYCIILKHSNAMKETISYEITSGVSNKSQEKINKEINKLLNQG